MSALKSSSRSLKIASTIRGLLAGSSIAMCLASVSYAETGTWVGGNGDWDTSAANWTGLTTLPPWDATNGASNTAIFGGVAGTVNLLESVTASALTFNTSGYIVSGANTLNLAGATPTITTGTGFSATISSVIAGTNGLTKAGAGTLTLSGANTYTGATIVSVGTLKAGAANVFGSITPTAGTSVASGATLDLGGFAQTIGSLSGTGTVTSTVAGGSLTLGGDNGTATFSGTMNSANIATITKVGTGTQTLSGTAVWSTSATTQYNVNEGALTMDGTGLVVANQLTTNGWVVSSGATLNLVYNPGTANTLIFRNAALSGAGTVNLTGTGCIDFWSPAAGTSSNLSGFTGQLNIGCASLSIQTDTLAKATTTASVNIAAGKFLDLRSQGFGCDKLTGTGIVADSHSAGGFGTLTVGTADGTSQFDGVIKDTDTSMIGYAAGGGIALTKTGTGIFTIAGTSTYTGATNVNGGTLRAGSATAFSAGSAVTLADVAGVTLDVNGQTLAIASLAGGGATGGNVTLGAGTLTAGGNNASTAFGGVISGTGGFTKAGTGTLTLSGTNTYSGVTSIGNGTVSVSNIGIAGANGNLGTNGTINVGSAGTQGILTYTGTGETTDRILNFAGTTGGATINNNGAGLLRFNAAATTTTGSGAKGLTFGGTGNGQIDGSISANGGLVNISKADAGTWTLAGVLNTAAGNVTVNGGTLVLSNASNNYTGVTRVNTGGTLSVDTLANGGVVSNIGSSTNAAANLVFGGGTLKYTGATGSTDRAFTVAAASNLEVTNAGTTLTIANDVAAAGGSFVLTKTGAGTVVLGGTADNSSVVLAVSSGEVRLDKSAAGVRAVAGINSVLAGATVKLTGTGGDQIFGGSAAANRGVNGLEGTLDLNGLSESVSNFSGTATGLLTNSAAATNVTFTVGETNATSSFAGVIQNGAGTVALTKIGTGTQTLSGANTYTGVTNVTGGTLLFAKTNSLLAANWTDAKLVVSSGATAGFNVGGSGEFTSADIDTFKGLTNVASGVTATQGFKNGSLIGLDTTNAGGTFTYGSIIGNHVAGTTVDTLGLNKLGTGTLSLTGANTYTGNTVITAGTLQISGTGTFGGGFHAGTIANSGTLQFSSSAAQTFAGAITGTGALIKDTSASTLTLSSSGTNYSGATTVNSGTLNLLGAGGTIGYVSATTVNNGSTLMVTSQANLAVNAAITLNNGATLTHNGLIQNGNYWTNSQAVTVAAGAAVTFNEVSITNGTAINKGTFLDGGLKGGGANTVVTMNATNGGNGFTLRNAATSNFAGKIVVNGIANGALNQGSGLAVAGETTGLQNADIEVNGTLELGNQGLGWAGTATATAFTMGTLTGTGVVTNNNATQARGLTVGNTNLSGTFSGALQNGVAILSLTKVGSGTQTLTGPNTFTGATAVNGGTLQIGGAGSLGLGAYAGGITVGTGANLRYSSSLNQTLSGVITGAGSLIKDTAGSVLTLSGASPTFTGAATVSAGMLNVTGSLGSGISVASGGTILGSGSTTGALTLGAGSTMIAVGGTAAGTNGTAFTAGNFDSSAGSIAVLGTVSAGLVDIVRYTGTLTGGLPANFNLSAFRSAGSVASVAGAAGNKLQFSATTDTDTWSAASGTWDNSHGAGLWTNSSDNAYYSGDAVQFNNVAGQSTAAVTIGGIVTPGSISFNNTTTNYTFGESAPGTGTILGSVTKSGTGSVKFTANNPYTGNTVINNAGGTLEIAGSLGGGSYTGTVAIGTGSAFKYSSSANQVLAGVISGAGAVTKEGASTLILTGVNTYSGGTAVNAGTLQLGDGTINPTITGAYNVGSAGTLRVQYNAAGVTGAPTFSGVTGAGTLSLVTGKIADSGWGVPALTSGFIGKLQIESGRIAPSAIANLGGTSSIVVKNGGHFALYNFNGAILSQNFTVAGSGYGETNYESAIRLANAPNTNTISGTVTLAGDATLAASGTGIFTNTISGNFNLAFGTANQAGLVILQGANTYTGATTVRNGALNFARTASFYNNTIDATTAAKLTVNSGATAGFGIGGANGFTEGQISTLLGASTNAVGFLNGALLGLDTTNAAGGNYTYGTVIANTYGGANALGLNKLGTGTLTLNLANTYTGATTVSGGILKIDGAGTLGGGTYAGAITNNATLQYSSSANQTFSGAMSGTGTLIKDASNSTLTLASSNNNSGSIVVNQGTLSLNNTTSGFANRKTVGGNGIVLNGTTLSIDNTGVGYTGGWVIVNGGTGSLSGSGTININSGVFSRDNTQLSTINTTATVNVASGAFFGAGRGGNSTIGALNGAGTVTTAWTTTSAGSITLGNGGVSGNFSGQLRGSGVGTDAIDGGILSVIKIGTGTQTLSGASTYTGATSVFGGALQLDFGAAQTPDVSANILPAASALVLSGGTVEVKGGLDETNTQTLAGLSGTGGTLKLTSGGGTNTINLTLGGITSNAINFVGSDATVGATGSRNFLTATVAGSGDGMTRLGGSLWEGTGWASTSSTGGSHVVAWGGTYAPLITNGVGVTNTAGDLRISGGSDAGTATTYDTAATINSLLMAESANGSTVDLTTGTKLTVGNGASPTTAAIAIGSAANSLTIGSTAGQGTLTAGTSGNTTLNLVNYNPASTLTVNSVIADNTVTTGLVSLSTIGKVVLNATNTFTGGTSVNGGGTLQIAGSGKLGSAGSYAGAMTNNGTLQYSSSAAQALTGVISGVGSLIKDTNSSILTLTGANTYTGGTTINAGTVQIGTGANTGSSAALGTGTVNVNTGTTLKFWLRNDTGNSSYANNLSVNGGTVLSEDGVNTVTGTVFVGASGATFTSQWTSKNLVFSNAISGGNVSVSDIGGTQASTVVFSSSANSYNATTIGSNVTLQIGIGGSNVGSLGTGAVTVNSGGTLKLWVRTDGLGTSYANDLIVNGGTVLGEDGVNYVNGTVSIGASGATFVSQWNNKDLVFRNVISGGNVTVNDAGGGEASKVIFTGTNTYTGTTTIGSNETLQIGGAGTLGSGNYAANISNSGTLNYASTSAQTLGGIISGTGSLTKAGTGTLTLTGLNTYSGATNVETGTLVVNGSVSGAVTVKNGATLGGSGTITGDVLAQSGSFLSPGNSPGQLDTGNLTVATGSNLLMEIGGTVAGTQYDQLNVTGSVTLGGNLSLALVSGFTPAPGQMFWLTLNDTNSDAISGFFANVPVTDVFNNSGTLTAAGQDWTLYYGADFDTTSSTGGNDVMLTMVPEPTAVTALLLGLGTVVGLRRRRSRQA